MYRLLYRLVIRRLDAELAHRLGHFVIRMLPFAGGGWWLRLRAPASMPVHTMGLAFANPVGIAAGFDKDATAVAGLGQLGFGHVEIGTVTAQGQPGNPRPRMFRLEPDAAIINRMGFNNRGAQATAERLRAVRRRRRRPIVGVNIGKTRIVAVEDAVDDYRTSARVLAPLADYLVVNVSSPNTPGLRGLQERELLEPLLSAVLDEAGPTPVLVKIAPDLADDDVVAVTRLAVRLGLAGLVATNTTVRREGLRSKPELVRQAGGLSGAPLAERALEVLRLVRGVAPHPEFCVISAGGIATAADAAERLSAGATLVQAYTAFVYAGPFWARGVVRALATGRPDASPAARLGDDELGDDE